jgi:hypothetical protein
MVMASSAESYKGLHTSLEAHMLPEVPFRGHLYHWLRLLLFYIAHLLTLFLGLSPSR